MCPYLEEAHDTEYLLINGLITRTLLRIPLNGLIGCTPVISRGIVAVIK